MKSFLLSATVLLGFSVAAQAATFQSAAHDNTVEIFSSSKKKEKCDISLAMSYFYPPTNSRQNTVYTCHVDVEIGDHLQVCHTTHPMLMEPKTEGTVQIKKCVDRE